MIRHWTADPTSRSDSPSKPSKLCAAALPCAELALSSFLTPGARTGSDPRPGSRNMLRATASCTFRARHALPICKEGNVMSVDVKYRGVARLSAVVMAGAYTDDGSYDLRLAIPA